MRFDDQGRELPDPTPLEIPAGMRRPESLEDQVRRLVRTHMSRQAVAEGNESFEEANDFEIPEDDAEHFETRYEMPEMAEEVPIERAQRVDTRAEHGKRGPAVRESSDLDDEAGAAGAESGHDQVDAFPAEDARARGDRAPGAVGSRVPRGAAARVKGAAPRPDGRESRGKPRVDRK